MKKSVCFILIVALSLTLLLVSCDQGNDPQPPSNIGGTTNDVPTETPTEPTTPGTEGNNSTTENNGNTSDIIETPPVESTEGLIFTLLDDGSAYAVTSYEGIATEVVIAPEHKGKPVTRIEEGAFSKCDSLTSVIVPDSVTHIGKGAFRLCSSLQSLTLPFVGASSDGADVFPLGYIFDSVKGAGKQYEQTEQYYFDSATNRYYDVEYAIPVSLVSVTITGDYIPGGAFYNCNNLTSVTMTGSVESIESSTFSYCVRLTSITIPNSVKSINFRAFSGCDSLTSVIIPDGVTTIDGQAFAHCDSLNSVTIPNSVMFIGDDAFNACKALIGHEYGEAYYLGNDNNPLLYLYKAEYYIENFVVPNSTRFIGSHAFEYQYDLQSVTISDSVISIGKEAFAGCQALTSLELPDSVTHLGLRAIFNCDSLTSMTIPDSVTYIDESIFFGCGSLNSVVIGCGITAISYGMFTDCSSLEKITLPTSVIYIGYMAFEGCFSMRRIEYEGTEEQWAAVDLGTGNDPLLDATVYYNWTGE